MKRIAKKKMLMVGAAACLALCAGGALNNVAVNAADANLVMKTGASLYLDEVSGLKFAYTVNNYDAQADKNYGMLIVPYDYLEKADISLTDSDEEDYVSLLQAAELPFDPIVEENLQPKQVNGEWLVEKAITELKDQNYVREWFGIGFEKTTSGYVYATSDDNVRSVFEVANLAQNKIYTDAFDESKAEQLAEKNKLIANKTLLDSYITTGFDFVYGSSALSYNGTYVGNVENDAIGLNLTNAEGKENIDLSSQMHWTTKVDSESVATVSAQDWNVWNVSPVSFGETKFTATLGGAKTLEIDVPVYADATQYTLAQNAKADSGETEWVNYNADGSVSVRAAGYGDGYIAALKARQQGYVGFAGTYGANTYVDVEFTGNNMPMIRLFADEINGKFAFDKESDDKTGVEGLLLWNGTDVANSEGKIGPTVCLLNEQLMVENTRNTSNSYGITNIAYNMTGFSMQSMIDNPTTEYKLTVGNTQDKNGVTVFRAILSQKTSGEWVTLHNAAVTLNTLGLTYEAGNIVLMSPLKEEGAYTTFKCSMPYTMTEAEVGHYAAWTETSEGVYDLTMTTTAADYVSNHVSKGRSFFALNGTYGVGTYVDVEFTGPYVPVIHMFSQGLNSTVYDTTGVIVANGVKGMTKGDNMFTVWSGNETFKTITNRKYSSGYLYAAINAIDANAKNKLTIGTYKGGNGTVVLEWYLYTWFEAEAAWKQVMGCTTEALSYDGSATNVSEKSKIYTSVTPEEYLAAGAIVISPTMTAKGTAVTEVNYKCTVYTK